MNNQDRIPADRPAELKREIQIGLDELDRGEGIAHDTDSLKVMFENLKRDLWLGMEDVEQVRMVPGEQVFEELRRRSEEKRSL